MIERRPFDGLGGALHGWLDAKHHFSFAEYLVTTKGKVEVNGVVLDARDGAAIHDEESIRVTASEDAELVLVDAPAAG